MSPSFSALLAASFSYPSIATLSSRTSFAEIFRANPVFSAVAIFRDSPTTKLLRDRRISQKAINLTET